MILPKVPNTPVKESEDINMDEIMNKQRVHKIAFFFLVVSEFKQTAK